MRSTNSQDFIDKIYSGPRRNANRLTSFGRASQPETSLHHKVPAIIQSGLIDSSGVSRSMGLLNQRRRTQADAHRRRLTSIKKPTESTQLDQIDIVDNFKI